MLRYVFKNRGWFEALLLVIWEHKKETPVLIPTVTCSARFAVAVAVADLSNVVIVLRLTSYVPVQRCYKGMGIVFTPRRLTVQNEERPCLHIQRRDRERYTEEWKYRGILKRLTTNDNCICPH